MEIEYLVFCLCGHWLNKSLYVDVLGGVPKLRSCYRRELGDRVEFLRLVWKTVPARIVVKRARDATVGAHYWLITYDVHVRSRSLETTIFCRRHSQATGWRRSRLWDTLGWLLWFWRTIASDHKIISALGRHPVAASS